jgi:hypothetical protein
MGFSKELASVGLRLWGAKAPGFDYEGSQCDFGVNSKRKTSATLPDFDAADLMECGLVNAPWVLQQPESFSVPRRQMQVKRSKNKLEHTLYDEKGCVVLTAHTIKVENKVKIFAAGDDPKKAQPVFTLVYDHSTTKWELTSNCSGSDVYRSPKTVKQGGQTLMRARHGKETIGHGLALVMEAEVPEVTDQNGRLTWSPLQDDAEPQSVLASKRPTWNKRLQSLSMDFGGVVKLASAKNVQLLMDDDCKLVFGKVEPGVFILDFEHPLSVAQAFAIGLSTMFWD